MFKEEYDNLVNLSKKKMDFYKNNTLGFFVSSMLAGMFVGLGILLIFTISGQLAGQPYTKLIMGATFGIALSLVIMAGSDLFTGNNLIISGGLFKKELDLVDSINFWLVCYIGNFVGSLLVAGLFLATDLNNGATANAFATVTDAKTNIPLIPLFFRSILCNILVCLAVWCSLKLKSESGKLIMIWWCLLAFITTGFEHSIANMTVLTIGLFEPGNYDITIAGYFYNIIVVTLGNMIGGIFFVSLPYYLISKNKK